MKSNPFYFGLTYVFVLSISILVLLLGKDEGGLTGGIGYAMLWGLVWFIINIVFGYKSKKKFKSFKASNFFTIFLLSHLTFSLIFSLLGVLIGKGDFEEFWMGFTFMVMFGLLFGGLSYSFGVWIGTRK